MYVNVFYISLTFYILYKGDTHLIIAIYGDWLCKFQLKLIHKSLNPYYLFHFMSQGKILSFCHWCRYNSLFFTASQYYSFVEEEIVAHYQLTIFWISSKVAVYVVRQAIWKRVFCCYLAIYKFEVYGAFQILGDFFCGLKVFFL